MSDLPDYNSEDDNYSLNNKPTNSKNPSTDTLTEITEQNAEDLLKIFNK